MSSYKMHTACVLAINDGYFFFKVHSLLVAKNICWSRLQLSNSEFDAAPSQASSMSLLIRYISKMQLFRSRNAVCAQSICSAFVPDLSPCVLPLAHLLGHRFAPH